MIKNKAGLSTVVTTLIIILLVLVAIGIIWVVVSDVLKGGATEFDIAAKCLGVDVSATSATCTSASCTAFVLKRSGTSSEEIGGVKLVFSNSTTGGDISDVVDLGGNIEPLVGKSTTTLTITGLSETPNKVEVTVYFKDETGTAQLCPGTTEFNF